MLKRVEKEEGSLVKDYIGSEYDKCLYLYLDFIKYGLNNENLKFWLDIENDEINCVILKYYSGMHIFSKNKDCSYERLAELIAKEAPSVICAEKFLIENLHNVLENTEYIAEYGWIRVLSKHYECDNSMVRRAEETDIEEISRLIVSDHMGEFHELEEFMSQMKEREDDNYSRNYIVKDDGKIISSASTTAEIDGVAVLSYVITVPSHRGMGLATKVCSRLCNDLIDEGKNVYLINYTDESTKLYDKLGFKVSCEIGKLYLGK